MINSHQQAPLQRLSPELMLQIVLSLQVKDILALALTCRQLADFVLHNDLVFKRLMQRDYGITYKRPDQVQSWIDFYKSLYQHPNASLACCRHVSDISSEPAETKRVLYRALRDNSFKCDVCHTENAGFLDMLQTDVTACISCVKNPANQLSIVLECATGNMYCLKCKDELHKLGTTQSNPNEQYKIKAVMDHMNGAESLDNRRKAEHLLYIQELRREDMTLKHYLVEKNWGRTWMVFRTREGTPLPGRITNQKLARSNGSLNPNIRLPVDKFRPAPDTNADIVSEKLWSYLQKAYGLQGRAFSEDDLQYPEYTRLRAYIEHFKSSPLAYP
ncbi:hypothetical protein LRAMOSA07204 [Lichtheimia ramosa]|uniref:DUSP domain-containing protein n=1 Tax=Lichtheimia ramosa TaxID=688394 RepID=A0A077WCB4_9FUNG|nr:hypothetical protein LRAMOSA07204 [Lichtheimia ramosa]